MVAYTKLQPMNIEETERQTGEGDKDSNDHNTNEQFKTKREEEQAIPYERAVAEDITSLARRSPSLLSTTRHNFINKFYIHDYDQCN